jgi:hypothetical protein
MIRHLSKIVLCFSDEYKSGSKNPGEQFYFNNELCMDFERSPTVFCLKDQYLE